MAEDLKEKVVAAAILVDTTQSWIDGWPAMRSGVEALVERLDPPSLGQLAHYLDHAPQVPASFRPGHPEIARSFAWSMVWTETLCETFYQVREKGIEALRAAAFSASDSSYGTAFYLLCRLAAQGVERKQFIQDVRREFPQASRELQTLMVDAVLRQGVRQDAQIGRDTKRDGTFDAEVEQLERLPGWGEAKEELFALDEDS